MGRELRKGAGHDTVKLITVSQVRNLPIKLSRTQEHRSHGRALCCIPFRYLSSIFPAFSFATNIFSP